VRFTVTVLLWLLTTAGLAVAVPAAWTQKNIIDPDGYAAMAEKAAKRFGLFLGLDLHAFPVDEGVVERGIARARDHPPGELGLLVQHAQRHVYALFDPLELRFQQLHRPKAMADVAAILLQPILQLDPQRTAAFGGS